MKKRRLKARKAEFRTLYNELRALESKEPREYNLKDVFKTEEVENY